MFRMRTQDPSIYETHLPLLSSDVVNKQPHWLQSSLTIHFQRLTATCQFTLPMKHSSFGWDAHRYQLNECHSHKIIDHREDVCHQKTTFHLSENALTTVNVYLVVHESSFPWGKVPEPTLSSLRSSLQCLISTLSAYLQLQEVLTFAIAYSSLTVAERNHRAICVFC